MSQETSLYLRQRQFDPKLKNTALYRFIANIRIPVLIMLSVIIAGIFGYATLPRRVNPEVEIPIVFVSATLPGASPNDVETLITEPIEDAIEGVEGVERITSQSLENISTTVVEFESTIDPDTAQSDVQNAVNTVTDLPVDASTPRVIALDFEDVPVLSFAVTTEKDYASLTRFSKTLQEALEDTPSINTVVISGLETQEIRIVINEKTASEYNISINQIQQQIRNQLKTLPAGQVTTGETTFVFSIDPGTDSIDDIRNILITSGQNTLKLSEIATVSQNPVPNQPSSFYASSDVKPQRAVTFSVFKVRGVNIDQVGRESKEVVDAVVKENNGDFTIVSLTDYDQQIQDQFAELFRDFSTSIGLVFVTLFLFLGLRQAGLASVVIPISFLFTFAVLKPLGGTLNFISIFSLLLAQGMIIDDTIVIISAMTDYYKTKKFTPAETGVLVWKDYIVPILTSNLTNIWSFLPLLLATGIIGEFIKILPTVVIIALVGSTAIAVLVTLPLMVFILKPKLPPRVRALLAIVLIVALFGLVYAVSQGSPLLIAVLLVNALFILATFTLRKRLSVAFIAFTSRFTQSARFKRRADTIIDHGFINLEAPLQKYRQMLQRILRSKSARWKTIGAVVLFSVFSYLLVPLGLVQNEFFPKSDFDNIFISLQLPAGTSLQSTTLETLTILERLRTQPDMEYVIADIGAEVDFSSVSIQTNTNQARFTIKLPDITEREVTSMEIAQRLRQEFQDYTTGELLVIEATSGPPAGAEIQIKFLGEDIGKLENYADAISAYLNSQPGVTNVEKSIKPNVSRITFVPDYPRLAAAGLSPAQVGLAVRTYLSPLSVDTVQFFEDEEELVLRQTVETPTPEEISKIMITTSQGNQIPLLELGSLTLQPNPNRITREEGKRSISVSAAAKPGYNPTIISSELVRYAQTVLNLEPGYEWKTGGINEENQRSVTSILQSMAVAAILILVTMVIQLKSFRKAIIVMLVIPLAVSGVFIMFGLTGTPLSFPALIGVLALFGIVVKNSILVVDKINQNLETNIPFTESVADGAASRLEPILFSSITNFIGLIPITISDPLWRGLGGAIISGLLFSGTIMLFFIPVIYYQWFKPKGSTYH